LLETFAAPSTLPYSAVGYAVANQIVEEKSGTFQNDKLSRTRRARGQKEHAGTEWWKILQKLVEGLP